MSFDKRRMIMKAVIESLNMDVSFKNIEQKTNRLHERALKIVYSDYKSSFCEVLGKDKSVSIHFTSFYIIYHLELVL